MTALGCPSSLRPPHGGATSRGNGSSTAAMPCACCSAEVGRQAAHGHQLRRPRRSVGDQVVAGRASRDREADGRVAQAVATDDRARPARPEVGRIRVAAGAGRGRRRRAGGRARRPRTARRRRCARCRRARRRAAGRGRAPRSVRRGRGRSVRSARRALALRAGPLAQGEADRLRLEPRLGQLAFGIRVGDDPAARRASRPAPADTTAVRIGRPSSRSPVGSEQPERAGVDAARAAPRARR